MSWRHILRYGNGHRYSAARAFIQAWFGELEPEDGIAAADLAACEQRLGVPLPPALHDWYDLVGARDDLLTRDHVLLAPSDLEWWHARLPFWTSADAHRLWFVRREDIADDDPPVFLLQHDSRGANQWAMPTPLARFVTQMLLVEVCLGAAGHGLTARVETEDVEHDVAPLYPALPLPEWPVLVRRLYGDDDTLLLWSQSRRLHVAARDRAAFSRVLSLLEGRGYEIEVEWTE